MDDEKIEFGAKIVFIISIIVFVLCIVSSPKTTGAIQYVSLIVGFFSGWIVIANYIKDKKERDGR